MPSPQCFLETRQSVILWRDARSRQLAYQRGAGYLFLGGLPCTWQRRRILFDAKAKGKCCPSTPPGDPKSKPRAACRKLPSQAFNKVLHVKCCCWPDSSAAGEELQFTAIQEAVERSGSQREAVQVWRGYLAQVCDQLTYVATLRAACRYHTVAGEDARLEERAEPCDQLQPAILCPEERMRRRIYHSMLSSILSLLQCISQRLHVIWVEVPDLCCAWHWAVSSRTTRRQLTVLQGSRARALQPASLLLLLFGNRK